VPEYALAGVCDSLPPCAHHPYASADPRAPRGNTPAHCDGDRGALSDASAEGAEDRRMVAQRHPRASSRVRRRGRRGDRADPGRRCSDLQGGEPSRPRQGDRLPPHGLQDLSACLRSAARTIVGRPSACHANGVVTQRAGDRQVDKARRERAVLCALARAPRARTSPRDRASSAASSLRFLWLRPRTRSHGHAGPLGLSSDAT